MNILFGLETEIGISREDPSELDVVAESIALVRSARAPGVRMCWDYSCEDPHLDMRGFRVEELRQDTDESNYFAQDAARPLSFTEIKSDLVLRNGGRFYNDHAHPEYCLPECRTLLDLLQQDYTGNELMMACARAVPGQEDNPVLLYKNNTDFQGHSYGCHENYLIPRLVPWSNLAQAMTAFLTTRQIYAGAGKFGWEMEDRFIRSGFQVSQRSDFFSVLQSVDTMQRRPIINTRDEPHANSKKYRRFHVIIGDANMSLYSTWLKVGTTAMVLQAIVNGAPLEKIPELENPLEDVKRISRDPKWKWHCTLANGKETTAIEVQRQYLSLVKEYVSHPDPEWSHLLKSWEAVLNDLESDPLSTADRLDWPAKYQLIEQFRDAEKLPPDDPWLRSLDLTYHLLDRDQGLFFGLMDQNAFQVPYDLGVIQSCGLCPPRDTRAAVRGYCIEKFGTRVESAQWDHVRLRGEEGLIELDLRDVFEQALVQKAVSRISAAKSVDDLSDLPFAKKLR